MPYFSIIIPVYNRPDEVEELLESLAAQSCKDFDIVLVEDGSTIPCDKVANRYNDRLDIHYYYKPNEGRSIARNYGMERADGRYFVFFDSDCIIPPQYFATVKAALDSHYSDCYGGPDAAHDSFHQHINHQYRVFFYFHKGVGQYKKHILKYDDFHLQIQK